MVQLNIITKKWTPVRGHNNKIIGQSNGHTFKKNIQGSKHILRKPLAIAIDASTYEEQIAPTHRSIEVFDSESQKTYISSIVNFNKHKGILDRGHGKQYFLTLNHWQVTDLNQSVSHQLSFSFGVSGEN